jgi:hypothetical protein
MKKTLLFACLFVPAAAHAGPESARAAGKNSFLSLGDLKLERAVAPSVRAKPAGKPVRAASLQTVSVSGSVNLTGNGNKTPGSSFVWVDFSGYATVSDGTGRVTSNSTWFHANIGCNANGDWINCDGWPSWSVEFYKDGRYAGSGTVSGSLHASAFAPNGFFSVNSYTSLSGTVTLTTP